MFDDITPESIKNEILENIESTDTREGSFCNTLVSPMAYKMWEMLQSMNACIPIAFVDETSGEYIDKRASEFGLERKSGTKAVAQITFTGENGTVIRAGSVFLAEDGYEYILDETVVIGESKSAKGNITAAETGEIYNTAAGTITGQYKTINGLTAVTNNTPAIGGTDKESDESFVNRLYEFWRQPATSGNSYHYKRWAKEVNDIGDAKVFPLWNGNGTVKVVIASSDMKQCSEEIVNECTEYIESVRPIGATVTVESAVEKPINISAQIKLTKSRELSEIKADIEKRIVSYLNDIVFKDSSLLYNKIGYIILDTEGVVDYTRLTVNGGSTNITINENELVVKGSLEVTAQ